MVLLLLVTGYDIYDRHRDLRHPPVVEKSVEKPAYKGTAAGELSSSPHQGITYVWIPPGTFKMGCVRGDTHCGDDEKQHPVTLTHGFWIGQKEVTVGEYLRYVKAHQGTDMPPAPAFNKGWGHGNQPIVNLTWEEAGKFCAWDDGRLPSEAEWEYAARGRSETVRSGDLDEIAWYLGNSNYSAHDVAQKSPNYIGLYDTLGNAWEWVNDWWSEDYYNESPAVDPPGPASGNEHVLRGGAYRLNVSYVRFSDRNREGNDNKSRSYNTFGVRCARN